MPFKKRSIILAAGRGRRLAPLTLTTPKPLLKVHGRECLDLLLTSIEEAGVRDHIIVIGHLGDLIVDYVSRRMLHSTHYSFVKQTTLNGTEGAMAAVKTDSSLMLNTSDCILVTASDYVLKSKYIQSMLCSIYDNKADIVIGVRRIPAIEAAKKSIVSFRKDGRISKIYEKPIFSVTGPQWSAMLLFACTGAIWTHIRSHTTTPKGEKNIQTAINSWIRSGARALPLHIPGVIDLDLLI